MKNKQGIIKRYTELHGILLSKKEGLWIKVTALGKKMDYEGILNRYDREIRRIELFKQEIGLSPELDEFKSLTISLFQPKPQLAGSHSEA